MTANKRISNFENTRKAARVILSTIKRIGNSRGVTLQKIHDYIHNEYPNSPSNIIKLNNIMEKALAFGAVTKKIGNRYVLGKVIKSLEGNNYPPIMESKRRRRKKGGKRRRRSRSRRRRRRRRSASRNIL